MPEDEPHHLLIKLHERRLRHQERGLLKRVGVVVGGFLLVLLGIVLALPGVPGPGIATILLGLTFLALEFDRAERLLERAIVWTEAAGERAARSTPRQRLLAAAAALIVIAAGVAALIIWGLPLLPV